MFSAFPQNTLAFITELEANNTKEWFDSNKARYHQLVLEPCRAFVEEMGEHLMALVPTIHAVPKVNGSLFRIYRDQRFHFDEPPLKTHVGILFWQGSGKRMESSAFYMHFDPRHTLVAGGMRCFKPYLLAAYRRYIGLQKHRRELKNILDVLVSKGYCIPERRYKRFPAGFDDMMPDAELSLYDCMFAYIECDAAFITNESFIDKLYTHYEAMLPLQQWLYEMVLTAEKP